MQKISPQEILQNPFTLINEQWTLITTRAGEKTNAMTASWGGVGVLWNKPVVYVFIRPQRYTRELMEKSERFSLGFLPEQYRKELGLCGRESGRMTDKLSACGFDIVDLDGAPAVAQSELILTCRKLYSQKLDPGCFCVPEICSANYPQSDFHFMYIGEILGVYR